MMGSLHSARRREASETLALPLKSTRPREADYSLFNLCDVFHVIFRVYGLTSESDRSLSS